MPLMIGGGAISARYYLGKHASHAMLGTPAVVVGWLFIGIGLYFAYALIRSRKHGML